MLIGMKIAAVECIDCVVKGCRVLTWLLMFSFNVFNCEAFKYHVYGRMDEY
jgi:hypothetical protein